MKKIVLALGVFMTQIAMSQDIASGLVAYYPFNGNANDATTNALNATVHGATLTADVAGKPNSAYYFDGTSNYIDVPSNAKLNTAAFSYSVWIKLESNFFAIYPVLTKGKYNDTVNIQNTLAVWPDDNDNPDSVYQVVKTGSCGTYYQDGSINDITSKAGFQYGTWYHLVSTYSNGTIKLYVDGKVVSQSTSTDTRAALSCTSPFTIGAEPTIVTVNDSKPVVATIYYQGSIDEVRLYDRVITDQEVKLLYALPTGLDKTSNLPLNQMVYPNPSADSKFYFSDQLKGIQKVSVSDLTGKEVTPAFANNEYVDLSQSPSGLYTLHVTTSQGIYVGKIQK